MIARLEANRVFHLASMHHQLVEVAAAHERIGRQEAVLKRLLVSSSFRLAEVLSRLRHRAGIATEQPIVGKEEVQRALETGPRRG